jgi:radical SAM superfamily enzyme YgiQ (UPF0313 family)
MMGGPHTMMDPDLFLETGDFHYVFSGEAEESLLDVLDADGDPDRLRSILGISFKDVDGAKVVNEKRPLLRNLDALPFPDRTLLPLEPYVRRNPENLFYISPAAAARSPACSATSRSPDRRSVRAVP